MSRMSSDDHAKAAEFTQGMTPDMLGPHAPSVDTFAQVARARAELQRQAKATEEERAQRDQEAWDRHVVEALSVAHPVEEWTEAPEDRSWEAIAPPGEWH